MRNSESIGRDKEYNQLTQIDDELMARIVDYKAIHSMYPTLTDLQRYTMFPIHVIQRSLKNLTKLGKVMVVIIADKYNPMITG